MFTSERRRTSKIKHFKYLQYDVPELQESFNNAYNRFETTLIVFRFGFTFLNILFLQILSKKVNVRIQ